MKYNYPNGRYEKIKDSYLLLEFESFIDPVYSAKKCNEFMALALAELADHLQSTILAASTPFLLIRQAVVARRFQAIHSAERIRAINPQDVIENGPYQGLSVEANNQALQTAQAKLAAELADENGQKAIYGQIRSELLQGLDDAEAALAAQELLNQGAVGAWTAFEVFAKSVAKSVVNSQPTKGLALIKSDSTKAYFGGKGAIPAEILEEHQFDLTNSMGDAIFRSTKLESLSVIRAVFEILFPNSSEISHALKNKQLWMLNQRRHLIVHKRGIIDRHYLENTEDNFSPGERLRIQGDTLHNYLNMVRDLALTIANADESRV